jgi:hypothetical protein
VSEWAGGRWGRKIYKLWWSAYGGGAIWRSCRARGRGGYIVAQKQPGVNNQIRGTGNEIKKEERE